jgi:hypothetical protein
MRRARHGAPAAKIRQRQELRRSGAAGSHRDRRDRRARTRAASRDRAVREYR